MTNEATDPIKEMWKGLNALYLECPESVVDDIQERVSAAMDAAREDEAKGFADWITMRGYEQRIDGKWAKYYKREEGGDYTTAELYQLYLKHKNEKL